ncbi:MAG: DNA-directed RNA polymerase subunit alpha C-terminal domain-containing protein [Planctomycetota bacterium]|jgi:DNA-directed RNA polymerase subunit alpha
MPSLKDVETLIQDRKFDQAESLLSNLTAEQQDAAEVAYYRGVLLERTDRWEEAIQAFDEALQCDEQHVEATFHLAYLLDMRGEDERAVELYERCVADAPAHVSALTNLAVLYEDGGRFDEAARCLDRILAEHPNHARAKLFRKDVESSKTMYYDEDQERVREKHNAIMDIPVSDFELSVRSRNCLKQMDIHTLGDLLRVTEPQLMGYKNFGETSLNEIKAMLTQKGLHIGQGLEEGTPEAAPGAPEESVGETGVYARPVAELELSVRSRKCLQRLGINTLGELSSRTEAELLANKNFGQTSLNEIKRRLSEAGLSLRSPS